RPRQMIATPAPSRAERIAAARPMPESPPVIRGHHVVQLVGAFVVGRFGHRPRLELRFETGLAQVLLGKRAGIGSGAGLHRSGFLVLCGGRRLVGAIDLLLDVALAARGFFGGLGERLPSPAGFWRWWLSCDLFGPRTCAV